MDPTVTPVRWLPMFPLGTVLFPYAVLPLHVFEPRYRVMTRRCLESDNEFGVVLIERGSEVGGGDVRFDTGTLARIARATELPDGRFAIAAVGLRRLRVARWLPDDPFPQAEVRTLAEPPAGAADGAAVARTRAALEGVLDLWRRLETAAVPAAAAADVPAVGDDPVRASFELAAAAPIGSLDAQRVLEAPDAGTRLAVLEQLLVARADELRGRLGGG